MDLLKKIVRSWAFAFIAGLLIGVLIILAIRFFTYKPDTVHYHANFAVYINGQREEFKGPQYYEEFSSASCNPSDKQTKPNERAHMHSNINDVVHIHDSLVTWGNFFQNISWNIGDNFVASPDKIYQNTDKSELSFVLNGKPVDSIVNKVIQDRDRLLVSFGINNQQTLNDQFNSVANSAQKYDESKDTAACGANVTPSIGDRFHHLL